MAVDQDWSATFSSKSTTAAWVFIALGCFHEVQPITSGHRITLVYSLHNFHARQLVRDFARRWVLTPSSPVRCEPGSTLGLALQAEPQGRCARPGLGAQGRKYHTSSGAAPAGRGSGW